MGDTEFRQLLRTAMPELVWRRFAWHGKEGKRNYWKKEEQITIEAGKETGSELLTSESNPLSQERRGPGRPKGTTKEKMAACKDKPATDPVQPMFPPTPRTRRLTTRAWVAHDVERQTRQRQANQEYQTLKEQ
jgi:hypothetical protein